MFDFDVTDPALFTGIIIGLFVGVFFGRITAERPAQEAIDAEKLAATLRGDDRREVERLLRDGRKIDAVRHIRKAAGCGLKQAKAIADHLDRS